MMLVCQGLTIVMIWQLVSYLSECVFWCILGELLPASPKILFEKGLMSDVPLLIGNTAQEADVNPFPTNLPQWSWKDYDIYLTSKLSSFGENLTAKATVLYPHQVSPEYQFTSMVTDIRVTCPTNRQALGMATTFKSPIYRYIVTSIPSKPVNQQGHVMTYSYTGWDLLAFFGTIPHYIDNPSKNDLLFGHLLRQILLDFVNDGEMATWKQFPEVTGVISNEIVMAQNFKEQECELWFANSMYPDYAWKS